MAENHVFKGVNIVDGKIVKEEDITYTPKYTSIDQQLIELRQDLLNETDKLDTKIFEMHSSLGCQLDEYKAYVDTHIPDIWDDQRVADKKIGDLEKYHDELRCTTNFITGLMEKGLKTCDQRIVELETKFDELLMQHKGLLEWFRKVEIKLENKDV